MARSRRAGYRGTCRPWKPNGMWCGTDARARSLIVGELEVNVGLAPHAGGAPAHVEAHPGRSHARKRPPGR